LERLLNEAQEGGRLGSVIEILILKAIAHQTKGDLPAALLTLHKAMTLAEPEGYVRVYVDESLPMVQLLLEAGAHMIMPEYTGKLLAAFETQGQGRESASIISVPPASQSLIEVEAPSSKTSLFEPLSQRELEILRLFKTELSGPEIAKELVIALSTVRTHTKSIFSKLEVNNRRAAVKRAAELGLM
jgi:LuxR family transcriptional regulator, maltose regulon positive regulatory protein